MLLRDPKCGERSGLSTSAIIVGVVWGSLFWTVTFQPLTAQAQYSQPQFVSGPTPPGTSIIPGLSVAERYDTNIYLAPPSLLPPGTQLHDFVTTAQGSLKALHKDKNVEASLMGGVDGNVYAHTTELNYISTRVDTNIDLTGWAQHFAKRAQLRVYDYFRYTPTSPGFLQGGKSGTEDPFQRGIQGFRANTYSNTANVDGVLPVYRDVGVQAGYSYSLYRVGSILAATSAGISYFNTTVHAWTAGPRLQVSQTDSVAILYKQNLISQEQTTNANTATPGAAVFNTNTQSVTANYTRATSFWTFAAGGGVTLIEPASKAFATGNIRVSTNPERTTVLQLDLTRQASPSFYLQAGAMISNVAQVQVIHMLDQHLRLRASANYGFNEIVPTSSNTTFNNFVFSTGLNYRITKSLSADLTYDYNNFETSSPGISYTVNRNVVGLMLTAEWR
jgi:hypothetical protein